MTTIEPSGPAASAVYIGPLLLLFGPSEHHAATRRVRLTEIVRCGRTAGSDSEVSNLGDRRLRCPLRSVAECATAQISSALGHGRATRKRLRGLVSAGACGEHDGKEQHHAATTATHVLWTVRHTLRFPRDERP